MTLEMKNIHKSFGAVDALKDVSFTVGPGETHGLLGENGAGKTTLMNVLAGTFPPDSGRIFVNGREIRGMTPRKSSALKIRFIHQELSLCNDLKVYQNMFLGEEATSKYGFIDRKAEIDRAQSVLDYMESGVRADAPLSSLETAQKQLVEIARALLFDSELIIMDEPTTALNTNEINHLFGIMNKLKKQGVSFIYISHKMPEVFGICGKYTVLRDGSFVQTGLINEIDERKAAELLIGKTFVSAHLKETIKPNIGGETVFSANGISGATFKDVSFSVRKGEVVVITGLQGSGDGELAQSLFGALPVSAGTLEIEGRPLNMGSIKSTMRSGVGMIPRNRKERGIVPHLTILHNHSLACFTSKHAKLLVSRKEEERRFARGREAIDIKIGSPGDLITSLSGGNQQKVILSKWLAIDAAVYIMDNPTQGIDIGSKYAIYKLILGLARQGKAVIVFTTEFPEIRQLADRCLVMYRGGINAVIEYKDLTEAAVMRCSTGGKTEAQYEAAV